MKMYITTDDGSLIHSLKYIEEYNLDKPIETAQIINFVREAQKTAKWLALNPTKSNRLSEKEIATLSSLRLP